MAISAPDVITRYFAAQSARDFDTLFTLFADDATVIDTVRPDGARTRSTWRENVASVYQYSTELPVSRPQTRDLRRARAPEGDFPAVRRLRYLQDRRRLHLAAGDWTMSCTPAKTQPGQPSGLMPLNSAALAPGSIPRMTTRHA